MRKDSVGMFWEDSHVPTRRGAVRAPLTRPAVPDTGWEMPEDFPDLSNAKTIAIDIESYDPDIKNGPGFFRKKGHVVGVAIAADDDFCAYYPIRHEQSQNFDADTVFRWLRKQLAGPQLKVGHNLLYDLEGLASEGVLVNGPLWDTMYAEALLNEHKMSYSLETTAKDTLNEGKTDSLLYKWLSRAYGGTDSRKAQAGNIYRAPVELVGPYAEGDVDLPLRLYVEQKKKIAAEGMQNVMELECSAINMLLRMRQQGVRVNVAQAEAVEQRLIKKTRELEQRYGKIDIWAAESLSRLFDKNGVTYTRTAKGAPSFTTNWFEHNPHPLCKAILEWRKIDKFLNTFIRGYIINSHVDGIIRGQFHPLRSDDGGTVSGRFSSSCPNLQNIPSRDEEYGPLIRSMFIPEDDHDWLCADYSQIEPRLLLQYAHGNVANSMRDAYRTNKNTDFYTLVMSICDVSRRVSKTLSLGMMYGMGQKKLASQLGLTLEQAQPMFEKYHKNLPFVRDTQQSVQQAAMNRGWIRTIGGRRARFPFFEPTQWSETAMPLPYDQAVEKWGNVRRAHGHKALNRLIQGSAADVFKTAVNKCFVAGLFDSVPLHLMVHDEIDASVPRTKEGAEALAEIIHIMETAVPLKLPLSVEYKLANNWGEAK